MIKRTAKRMATGVRRLFTREGRPVPGKVTLGASAAGTPAEPRLVVDRGKLPRGRVGRAALGRMERSLRTRLARALVPDGAGAWLLRWEELDLAESVLRQCEATVGTSIACVLSLQDDTVRLLPEAGGAGVAALGHDEAEAVFTRPGWGAQPPTLDWRYAAVGDAVHVRVRWAAAGLPEEWKKRLGEARQVLRCAMGDATWARLAHVPRPRLEYEGTFTLDRAAGRPERRGFEVEGALRVQPLDGDASGTAFDEPASFEVRDLRAATQAGWSRYVADADTALPVRLVVLVPEGALLPDIVSCRAGGAAGCQLRAQRLGAQLPPPEVGGGTEAPQPTPPGVEAWLLQSEQSWETLFGGAREWRVPAGRGEAAAHACLWRVADRRTRRAFVVAQANGELLAQVSEEWMVPGAGGETGLGREADVDRFGPRIALVEHGLREWFDRDSGSGLPQTRLMLGPDSWSVYAGGEVLSTATVYGSLGGPVPLDGADRDPRIESVRWRLRPGAPRIARAADWADPSAPVLVTGPGGPLCWGGLYVPEPVPWERLRLVQPQSHAPLVRIPATPRMAGLWIDLWGYVAGYERAEAVFESATGAQSLVVLWVARTPLPLFPAMDATLLRSFAPLHVVRDPDDPFAFHFSDDPDTPRPTLRMGAEVVDGDRPSSVKLGRGTQIAAAWGAVQPGPARFAGDAIPGMTYSLEGAEANTLWLALDVPLRGAAVPGRGGSGYLLRWDAGKGWSLGGLFAHLGAPVWLAAAGVEGHPLVLEEAEPRASEFRLVVERGTEARWEGNPLPPELPTPEALREWIEVQRMEMELRPEPLQGYTPEVIQRQSPRIVVFRREFSIPAERLAVRVWEILPGSSLPPRPDAGRVGIGTAEPAPEAARTIGVPEPGPAGAALPPHETAPGPRTIGAPPAEPTPPRAHGQGAAPAPRVVGLPAPAPPDAVAPPSAPAPREDPASETAYPAGPPLHARDVDPGPWVVGKPAPVPGAPAAPPALPTEGGTADRPAAPPEPRVIGRPPPASDGGETP
ncbi:hypothetical protein [Longimicrobium sp.]|jgi:hypothetical protein|uniref:hypothetical protein n=1 Tax=Longimicrobium sp. TaxID=2029185 RepID=UPI002ED880EC